MELVIRMAEIRIAGMGIALIGLKCMTLFAVEQRHGRCVKEINPLACFVELAKNLD
jgi:hypothetical protein